MRYITQIYTDPEQNQVYNFDIQHLTHNDVCNGSLMRTLERYWKVAVVGTGTVQRVSRPVVAVGTCALAAKQATVLSSYSLLR